MRDCCDGKKSDGSFDLLVIGAGSAGFSAAITATDGARVLRLSGMAPLAAPVSMSAACPPRR